MASAGGRHSSRHILAASLLVAFFLNIFAIPPTANAASVPAAAPAASEAVVVLALDQDVIAESFIVVDDGERIFLPVCAFSSALSLAITCQDSRAFGFVIEEARPLAIDLEEGYAISGRTPWRLNKSDFKQSDDLYITMEEASRVFPLDIAFDRNASVLQVHAREPLPLQGFRERQKLKRPSRETPHKDLDDFTKPRAAASIPTVDVFTQLQVTGEEHSSTQGASLNSVDVSGDLLYMSGEAHVSAENETLKRLDISLYRRRDPAFMVGPIPLTQVRLGSSQVPYLDGIGASSKPMYGIYLSNRPIYGSTNFLTHDINGNLPQGWDAELFHNGMPIGYQPPTPENMYHFQNLRLYYGANSFKVVLHGPFGEKRESEETIVSDAITPKGDVLYTFSSVWETGITDNNNDVNSSVSRTSTGNGSTSGANISPQRESNITLTSDFGISKYLTGATYLVRHTDLYGVERDFGGAGLRTAINNTLLSMDLIGEYYPSDATSGGLLTAKSSSRALLGLPLQLTQRFFWNYDSPEYPKAPDPLATMTTLKGNSSFTAYNVRIPFAMELGVGSYRSGRVDETSSLRLAGGWNGWNGAVEADLSHQQNAFSASGILQISTSVKEISIRGQGTFSFAPDLYAANVNVSADKDLGGGFLLNSSVSHDPSTNVSEFRGGISKKLGLVGYSFAGTATTHGAFSLTAGVRASFGADTTERQAIVSAEPLSPYGMIAVSAAVAEQPNSPRKSRPGVGFLINGSHATTVTGTKGGAVLVVQPDTPVDVTVDLTTVEDPFMVPEEGGCRITPRAGVVSACKFTMTTGGEIDGMVFVRVGGASEVPMKEVRVDLLREEGRGSKLQASTRSQESGYYLFKAVAPGNYRVVIPEAELARLKAAPSAPIPVTMPVGGDMVSGKDFYLAPVAAGKSDAPSH